jgi:hypothetical protein
VGMDVIRGFNSATDNDYTLMGCNAASVGDLVRTLREGTAVSIFSVAQYVFFYKNK